ncbi:phage tail assembly chaperone [uncultured Sphingomonas sp.]|uniref:phage tail assembly chaperone n=1 Tax=uncultured Sphingomonas sp. TaxID=158754 RepID=UPI0025E9B8D0|nr:phage tail assembly chaperone [uncultured Sphingomonas sp.]
MSGTFAPRAERLAGLAGGLLGWRPHEFWNATPSELASVLTALSGDAAEAPSEGEMTRLKEMFPDG